MNVSSPKSGLDFQVSKGLKGEGLRVKERIRARVFGECRVKGKGLRVKERIQARVLGE
jgi:hypothetical protein